MQFYPTAQSVPLEHLNNQRTQIRGLVVADLKACLSCRTLVRERDGRHQSFNVSYADGGFGCAI